MKPLRCWRAPRWAPLWLRRRFPGCWTQEEIDNLWERARKRQADLDRFSE